MNTALTVFRAVVEQLVIGLVCYATVVAVLVAVFLVCQFLEH